MRPDITEFSYGYALTSNMMDRFSLQGAGAPIFPNQQQEGASGGYDVQIPRIAVFLQFKLSECMVRRSALGATQLGVPHFRFHLRPLKHSQQHDLLRELEAAGNEVYYCAPSFHLPSELNEVFSSGQVIDRTAYFSPSDIGELPDNDEHFIAFRPDRTPAWLFSEPKELHYRTVESIFGPNAQRRLGNVPRKGSRDQVLRDLGDELLNIFERSMMAGVVDIDGERRLQLSALRRGRTMPDASSYLGFVSQTLFGCFPLLVPVASGQP